MTIEEFLNNFGDAKKNILRMLYDLFFTHGRTHVILTDKVGGNTGKTALIYIIEELTIFLDENPIRNFIKHESIENNVERWMNGNPSKPSCYKNYVDPKLLHDKKKWIMECTAEELKNIDIVENKIEVLELTKQFKNSEIRFLELFNEPEKARRNCYTLIAMTLSQSD
jgi:hypothetical protein